MIKRGLFLLLLTGCRLFAADRRDALDPSFDNVPFDQWLTEPNRSDFHWRATVGRVSLSFHQRLSADVQITLDGKDLENRRDHGRLVFLIQITDREGIRYQQHSSFELDKVDPNVRNAFIEAALRAFFRPGDYTLAVVVFDTKTHDHAAMQTAFRIPGPRDNSLLAAWRELPAVEFPHEQNSPDTWYLPGIRGRVEWTDALNSPARLNVLLNIAKSAEMSATQTTPSAGLDALLPTLKVLSEIGASPISEQVSVLDLARRRAVFHQEGIHDLDWPRLKNALGEANTVSIDLHSLSERHRNAQFFVSEVRKILRASDQPSVLVILTTTLAFEPGEDLQPISLESLPPCRVVYIRYHAPQERLADPFGERRMGRGRRFGDAGLDGPSPAFRSIQSPVDQLAATLKPLNPKIIDVETPAQITKALLETQKSLR